MDVFEAFGSSIDERLASKALARRIPFGGTFELLPYCNMKCKMCYIVHEFTKEWKSTLKSVDEWEKIIDDAIKEGMLFALITGGEPMVYPGIYELLERLRSKPIYVALNTNATLLTRKDVEFLSNMKIYKLNITLYGGSNETYARLCNNPKGFDQVTNAFALLNEYHIPFQINVSLTPDNYMDYDKMKEVANKYKAHMQMVYYMFPPYRKDQGLIENHARFTPEEASKVAIRMLKDKIKDKETRKRTLATTITTFSYPKNFGLYGQSHIACRGGLSSFWVDWRGRINGCGVHTLEHIDLSKVPFKEAYKQVVETTEGVVISEKCQYCKYRCICPVCVAGAYCETGSVSGTPEYLCEFCEYYAKELIEEYERLENENV